MKGWLATTGVGAAVIVASLVAHGVAEGEPSAAHSVDQRKACLTCHELDDVFEAKVQHAPVQAAECTACHNPHAARMDSLLRERPARLCGRCHESFGQKMDRAFLHEPVADGRCGDCHDPHSSAHSGLLISAGVELCASCHEAIGSWRERENQHSPFRRGRCSMCHDPHAGDFPGLAMGTGADICLKCHPVSAKFSAEHDGFPVRQSRCEQCHDPHASARPGLFRSNLHAPFEGGDCSVCHAGGDRDDPFRLVTDQTELCGDCHEEQVTQARTAPFAHATVGGGECTACHNPHAGEGASLLRDNERSVCLTCHDPGGGRSGQEGRFLSHGGLACSECHGPHGGERPFLLVSDPITKCNECHGHQHAASHPMGAGLLDPRNGRQIDCLSCHGIHQAPAEGYLHASGEGEICVGCHKEIRF